MGDLVFLVESVWKVEESMNPYIACGLTTLTTIGGFITLQMCREMATARQHKQIYYTPIVLSLSMTILLGLVTGFSWLIIQFQS